MVGVLLFQSIRVGDDVGVTFETMIVSLALNGEALAGTVVAMIVGWMIGRVILQAPDERLVKNGVLGNVARVTLVEGEAQVFPDIVFQLPASDEGEIFWNITSVR